MFARAGHDVTLSVEDARYRGAMAGLVQVADEMGEPESYDVAFFDTTGWGTVADETREKTPTVGDSSLADALEHDRVFGIEFMQSCGIAVPPWEKFTDPADAIRHIKKTKKRYVFKPCGNDADASSTYVSKSADDLLRYMDVLFRNAKVSEFLLQEFVVGTEISIEMWMNETGYYALNATLETKKLMAGDLGPATGCSGNVCWLFGQEPAVFKRGLKKAYESLREMGYVGMIDLNCICTETEVYGLEWTPRVGLEGTCNLVRMMACDFGEFVYAIAAGLRPPEILPRASFCATTRLSIPPYPTDGLPKKFYKEGVPIEGLTEKMLENFYAMDFRRNELNDEAFETAGISGWIGAAIGTGETIHSAFEKVRETLKGIQVPDGQWRNDVEKVVAKRYEELEAHGWLRTSYGDD
jgi:phosphoribosylamine-glycine ligase